MNLQSWLVRNCFNDNRCENMRKFDSSAVSKVGSEFTQQSESERKSSAELLKILQALLPQFGHQWNSHGLVGLRRQSLSRLLHYNHLYQMIVDVPGVICEFGVQWGAVMAQLINLRGIYEPYNHSRRIVGFDTFEGFPTFDSKDGDYFSKGDYATSSGYEVILDQLLSIHESFSPLQHIKKFEIVKGDVSNTIDQWLGDNPHAIVSMAIFDMDLYKPTRDVLQKIIPRLTKGSLLVFDELNCQHFPGETLAVNEVLGLNNISLRRSPNQPFCAWAVFGG